MKPLRVGIIGLGVGEKHIEGYERHKDCEVAVLCDFSQEKLSLARKKYPHVKVTENANSVLEDENIHVVSIASYDNFHYEQIVKAISCDKHIFVEKPLCQFETQAEHIHSLLKEKPYLEMSSNLILRKSPRFQILKEMIRRGELGDVFYVEGDYNYGRLHKITDEWRGKINFYSVICGGGVHIVDLLYWLTGEDIEEVFAYGNAIASAGSAFRYHDMVVAIVKFKSGLIGKISANFGCVMPHFHGLCVYGTKATFINGLDYGMLFDSRAPGVPCKKMSAEYPGIHKGDLIYGFVDAIVNNTKCEVSQEDIFRSMSVCFAIEKAVQKKSSVKVRYM